MVPHYWLIENQSGFPNESRNAIVLNYYLLIYSLNLFISNSWDHASFTLFVLVIMKKSAAGLVQPILEINNSHTLPFQKRSIHQGLHLDLLDLLLKYRY